MLTTSTLYHFPGSEKVQLSEVGGKALSLIKMTEEGLPVPPGFVLPVGFFAEWLSQLQRTDVWQKFLKADTNQLQQACADLKAEAHNFKLSQSQLEAIRLASERALKDPKSGGMFAVRSSSPEEDLEGSSFAGGYETILGVTSDTMEDAIRRAFASCLDHRVAVYKKQHGFDYHSPKIAVVVQLQIASDVAGVGFSLNPITNYYDEAVFNANWGLGETVVAGLATPDTYVVEKTTDKITLKDIGKKETSIWLLKDGGTQERPDDRRDQCCLSDDQIISLTHLITKVEQAYNRPMDIEWAFCNNELFLLQARPITTHVPLPPLLVTEPLAPRRLYLDATISVQGLYKPISVMGTSFLRHFFTIATTHIFGSPVPLDKLDDTVISVTSGRLYLNVSNAMEVAGKDRIVQMFTNMDPLAAKAIANTDMDRYKSHSKAIHQFPFHLLWHVPEFGLHIIDSRLLPEHAHRQAATEISHHMKEVRQLAKKNLPLEKLWTTIMEKTAKIVFGQTMPRFIVSRVALGKLKGIVGDELAHSPDFNSLEKSLPNNPTVEMGLALYHLSQLLPADIDPETFEEKLARSELPETFMEAWKEYMDKYGHRCVTELDIAAPRYRDNPRTLIDQLLTLRASSTPDDNPQLRFDKNQHDRHEAFGRLCERIHDKGWLQTQRFSSLYRVFETLGGYREMHKYLLIFALDILRQRVLQEAQELVKSKRLDSTNQVFDLTLENLNDAINNPNLDLRALAKENRVIINQLAAVPQLPQLIDSRGLILRPPVPPAKEGEAVGTAISAGVARGPIKVLHSPDEKPLEKGDILVARATDPGWTPLFVNASAVVLEIGGMLQHGALVAREYGLPCVAGIANATELWTDGTIVEVDGSAGIVRTITKSSD